MPQYQRNHTKKRKTIELPASTVFLATKIAKRDGKTFTYVVKELLEKFISRDEAKQRRKSS